MPDFSFYTYNGNYQRLLYTIHRMLKSENFNYSEIFNVMRNSEDICDAISSDRVMMSEERDFGMFSAAGDLQVCDDKQRCGDLLIYDISASSRKFEVTRNKVIIKMTPSNSMFNITDTDFVYDERGESFPIDVPKNNITISNTLCDVIGSTLTSYLYDMGVNIHCTKLFGAYYCDVDKVIYQISAKNDLGDLEDLINDRKETDNSPLLFSTMAQCFFHLFNITDTLGIQHFDMNRKNIMFTNLESIQSFAGNNTKDKKYLHYYLPSGFGVDELIIEVIDNHLVKIIDYGLMGADFSEAIDEFKTDSFLSIFGFGEFDNAYLPRINGRYGSEMPPENRKWLYPNAVNQIFEGVSDQSYWQLIRHLSVVSRKNEKSSSFAKFMRKFIFELTKHYQTTMNFINFIPGRSGIGNYKEMFSFFLSQFDIQRIDGKKIIFITSNKNYKKIYENKDFLLPISSTPVESRFILDSKITSPLTEKIYDPSKTLSPSFFLDREREIFTSSFVHIKEIDIHPRNDRTYFPLSSTVNPIYQRDPVFINSPFERVNVFLSTLTNVKGCQLFNKQMMKDGIDILGPRDGIIINSGFFVVDNNVSNLLGNSGNTRLELGTPIGINYIKSSDTLTDIPFPPIYNPYLAVITVKRDGTHIIKTFDEIFKIPEIGTYEMEFSYALKEPKKNPIIFTRKIRVPHAKDICNYYDGEFVYQAGPYYKQDYDDVISGEIKKKEFIISQDDIDNLIEVRHYKGKKIEAAKESYLGKKYFVFLYQNPKGFFYDFNNHYLFYVPPGNNTPTLYGMNFDNVMTTHNVLIQSEDGKITFCLFPGRGFGNYGIDRQSAVKFINNEMKDVKNIVFLDGGFSANAIIKNYNDYRYILASPERKIGTNMLFY